MKEMILYTDGGCRGNQFYRNVGAIGGILIDPTTGEEKEYKRGYRDTTNNRMEILAVLEGLDFLEDACKVTVYSDSAYLVNAVNQDWISNWKRNGWKRGKKELKNPDLWQQMDEMMQKHDLIFEKVKGHDKNQYNNRADDLVNEAMNELEKKNKS